MDRDDSTPVLIHVGYPKTASSWLQRFIFENSESAFRPLFGSDRAMRHEALEHFVRPGAFMFDEDVCAKRFHPAVRDAEAMGGVPVLSYERLAGTPHTGGHDSRDIADRLHAVLPGARILMVVREQRSMILSSYRQYVRNGAVGSLAAYLNPPGDGRLPGFRFEFFEYHRLVAHYAKLFGSANVLVLPYELFTEDPREFVSRCFRFAGATAGVVLDSLPYQASENRGFSSPALFVKRLLSRIVARRDTLNPHVPIAVSRRQELVLERAIMQLDRVTPAALARLMETYLRQQIAAAVGDRYRTSNHILAESAVLDLRRFGYDVAR